jgi:hypothetical protein
MWHWLTNGAESHKRKFAPLPCGWAQRPQPREGRLDHKNSTGQLERAVAALPEAGFKPEDIGFYH